MGFFKTPFKDIAHFVSNPVNIVLPGAGLGAQTIKAVAPIVRSAARTVVGAFSDPRSPASSGVPQPNQAAYDYSNYSVQPTGFSQYDQFSYAPTSFSEPYYQPQGVSPWDYSMYSAPTFPAGTYSTPVVYQVSYPTSQTSSGVGDLLSLALPFIL